MIDVGGGRNFMKINPGANLNNVEMDRRTDSAPSRASAASSNTEEGSSVLSSTVRTLAAGMQTDPGIRSEKVAQLRQAIGSGQYQVDYSALAGSMMRELT